MVFWNHDEKSCVVHVDGSYKVKKNKILEFLGKNKFPLITKSSESNTAWVYSSPVKLQVIIFAKIYDFQSMAQLLKACYVFRVWLIFMIKEGLNRRLRHRTNQHDVGRGKVKVSVIKMKKKTTTIGD
uniref:Uncharacterized protein n=1 Tax=Brassica campestris TaxID=3711 RepID=M4FB18_BRACM